MLRTNAGGIKQYPFEVDSSWRQAKADILSFEPEELFWAKLRALLQRRKNRNLFDLHEGLRQLSLDPGKLIASFMYYLAVEDATITRVNAEQRMLEKLRRSLQMTSRRCYLSVSGSMMTPP